MTTNRVPLPWMSIWATSAITPIFIPATPWIEAADAQHARAAWEIAEALADMEISPAWQVAETEDAPGAFNALVASGQGVSDVYYPSAWTTLVTDGIAPTNSNMLIRFGWRVVKSTGNPGLALATVAGVVEYQ